MCNSPFLAYIFKIFICTILWEPLLNKSCTPCMHAARLVNIRSQRDVSLNTPCDVPHSDFLRCFDRRASCIFRSMNAAWRYELILKELSFIKEAPPSDSTGSQELLFLFSACKRKKQQHIFIINKHPGILSYRTASVIKHVTLHCSRTCLGCYGSLKKAE